MKTPTKRPGATPMPPAATEDNTAPAQPPRAGGRRKAPAAASPVPGPAAAPPLITAAICTYNRYGFLQSAIASLVKQDLPADRFEILVIDNSPNPARSAAMATRLAHIRNLIWRHEATPGLSNARNVALGMARAPIIAYLDDDALADRDWLGKLLAAYEALGEAAFGIGGRVRPQFLGERPEWLAEELLAYLSVVDIGGETRFLQPGEWVAGANISFRVAPLRAAGGFSPALGRIGSGISLMSNDETEVADRLAALGGRMGYAPLAAVEHCVDPTRLNQEWFRRRIAWQAVSDYVRAPAEMRETAARRWSEAKVFLARQPPHLRTLRALTIDQADGRDLNWQMSSIYGTLICLLSGLGEQDD